MWPPNGVLEEKKIGPEQDAWDRAWDRASREFDESCSSYRKPKAPSDRVTDTSADLPEIAVMNKPFRNYQKTQLDKEKSNRTYRPITDQDRLHFFPQRNGFHEDWSPKTESNQHSGIWQQAHYDEEERSGPGGSSKKTEKNQRSIWQENNYDEEKRNRTLPRANEIVQCYVSPIRSEPYGDWPKAAEKNQPSQNSQKKYMYEGQKAATLFFCPHSKDSYWRELGEAAASDFLLGFWKDFANQKNYKKWETDQSRTSINKRPAETEASNPVPKKLPCLPGHQQFPYRLQQVQGEDRWIEQDNQSYRHGHQHNAFQPQQTQIENRRVGRGIQSFEEMQSMAFRGATNVGRVNVSTKEIFKSPQPRTNKLHRC
ncbi:unnamed protein product [Caenorhabditis auriculariae]|uniref:Uncharacterized protein n=1 Tax=Caenorhabditis auriculariae TaxID=2777116 RepID=A0A8S1H5H2_9PELO|nr:unnamed protein product [Caenorhabditis auriculariae]